MPGSGMHREQGTTESQCWWSPGPQRSPWLRTEGGPTWWEEPSLVPGHSQHTGRSGSSVSSLDPGGWDGAPRFSLVEMLPS